MYIRTQSLSVPQSWSSVVSVLIIRHWRDTPWLAQENDSRHVTHSHIINHGSVTRFEKRKSARQHKEDYFINWESFGTFWVATARNSSVLIKLHLQSHKQLHSSRNVLCHWVSNTIVFPSFTTQATAEVPSHLWKYMENCALDQQNGHLKFETHCFFSLHLVQHSFCFCLTRFVLSTWKRQQMTLQLYAKRDGAELARWQWISTAQTFDSTGGEKLTSRQQVIW